MKEESRKIAALLLALTTIACAPKKAIPLAPPQPAPGKLITLDGAPGPEDDTGWWPTVAFDSHQRPHVSFCDAHHGDVRYATETPAGWQVTSIVSKGAVGKYMSMAIDAHDRVGITFYDQDNLYLRYAHQQTAAGPFSDEHIAWGSELGMASTTVFDPNDMPHVFYYMRSGKLIHAVRHADDWEKTVLTSAMGVYSAHISAVSRADGIHLSFVDWKMRDAALHLGLIQPDGTFEDTVISAQHGPGWHSQLLYLTDIPYIVHSQDLTKHTGISHFDATQGWVSSQLLPNGSTFAAHAYRGAAVVAFQDTSDVLHDGTVLRYTRQTAGAWPVYRIDNNGPVGSYLSMAISDRGRMLVAYYANSARSLKLYDESLE